MNIFRKSIFATIVLGCLYCVDISAQSLCAGVVMPPGTQCITQSDANIAAANTLELRATKEKVATLEGALKTKDATIAENKDTADKNVADLTGRLHKTEVELANTNGKLTQCQDDHVGDRAVIQSLVQGYKARSRIGLINF